MPFFKRYHNASGVYRFVTVWVLHNAIQNPVQIKLTDEGCLTKRKKGTTINGALRLARSFSSVVDGILKGSIQTKLFQFPG